MMYFLKHILLLFLLYLTINLTFAQNKDSLKFATFEMINQAEYCALITIDEDGFPAARMMQTLPVEYDFVIWLGTKPNTQKIKHIENNQRVSVYYSDVESAAYVNVQGIAEKSY
jgi:general stress protein 26